MTKKKRPTGDRAFLKNLDLSEVLFEFRRQGRLIRIAAIDPKTNTEVVTIGARGYSERMLKMRAARKLAYVLARKNKRGLD